MSKRQPREERLKDLAEAYIFPVELPEEERQEADEQLRLARAKSQAEMTPEDRLSLRVLRLRLTIEASLKERVYRKECGFGSYLKEYINLQDKKRKVFADEISIDETLLSQLINERRDPPDYIFFRLEIHSNNVIPAQNWYKLVEKRREHEITTSKARRKAEKPFVRRKLQADS